MVPSSVRSNFPNHLAIIRSLRHQYLQTVLFCAGRIPLQGPEAREGNNPERKENMLLLINACLEYSPIALHDTASASCTDSRWSAYRTAPHCPRLGRWLTISPFKGFVSHCPARFAATPGNLRFDKQFVYFRYRFGFDKLALI
jgi:hypothetical protein